MYESSHCGNIETETIDLEQSGGRSGWLGHVPSLPVADGERRAVMTLSTLWVEHLIVDTTTSFRRCSSALPCSLSSPISSLRCRAYTIRHVAVMSEPHKAVQEEELEALHAIFEVSPLRLTETFVRNAAGEEAHQRARGALPSFNTNVTRKMMEAAPWPLC